MPRYLVIGGAGVIGSHLVDALLACGHGVCVFDSLTSGRRARLDPRAALITANLTDPSAMQIAMHGASGCFQLANPSPAVFEAAIRAGTIPVVYASSAAVYGAPPAQPVAETCAPAPRTAIGHAHLAAEHAAQAVFATHGLPSLGLRLFSVYGPRQPAGGQAAGVVARFADRLARGLPLKLHGDGNQTRDFLYIGDAIRMLLHGMRRLHAAPQAGILNACTGRATTIRALASQLAHITGVPPRFTPCPADPDTPRDLVGDRTLAGQALGCHARVPLEDGLAWTYGTHPLRHAA